MFRNIRVIATGQWLDVLFTVASDTFSVKPDSHLGSVADALNVRPVTLEVVDSETDQRTGPLLSFPARVPEPRTRRQELLAIARADWTSDEQKELLELLAQG
jgi:phosphoglycolate phosphatase-like HAD superfamily hydrolase